MDGSRVSRSPKSKPVEASGAIGRGEHHGSSGHLAAPPPRTKQQMQKSKSGGPLCHQRLLLPCPPDPALRLPLRLRLRFRRSGEKGPLHVKPIPCILLCQSLTSSPVTKVQVLADLPAQRTKRGDLFCTIRLRSGGNRQTTAETCKKRRKPANPITHQNEQTNAHNATIRT